jgi:hypothetical protein
MAGLAASSLGKALSSRSFVSKWQLCTGILPPSCGSLCTQTAYFNYDASSDGSRAEAKPPLSAIGSSEINITRRNLHRKSFGSFGIGVSETFSNVAKVSGSAAKAVEDARARARKALEYWQDAQRKAYLWIPRPVSLGIFYANYRLRVGFVTRWNSFRLP